MPVNPLETTNRLVPSYAPYTADDFDADVALFAANTLAPMNHVDQWGKRLLGQLEDTAVNAAYDAIEADDVQWVQAIMDAYAWEVGHIRRTAENLGIHLELTRKKGRIILPDGDVKYRRAERMAGKKGDGR